MGKQRLTSKALQGAIALVAVASLALAACGSDSSPSASTDTTGVPSSALRVTTLNVCNEAPIAWGMAKGVFAAHDVELELVSTTGGAAGLAAIMSGSADLSSTNPVSAIMATAQGFPIEIVSGSFNANPNGTGAKSGIVVLTSSGITDASGLAGKKVAVNELGSQNDVLTRAWLAKGGVDPGDVNMVALPFAELVPALKSGRVDAVLGTAAGVGALTADGSGTVIGDPLIDVLGPVPVATYIATDELVAEQGDLVARFRDAFAESATQVKDPANKDEYLRITSEFCKTPVENLSRLRSDEWTTKVDPAVLSQIAALLKEQKVLATDVDTDSLVGPTAR